MQKSDSTKLCILTKRELLVGQILSLEIVVLEVVGRTISQGLPNLKLVGWIIGGSLVLESQWYTRLASNLSLVQEVLFVKRVDVLAKRVD